MKEKQVIRAHGKGCTVTIDVSAGASKSEIVGINRWRGALQIRIAAEPKEGAANEELARFLGDRLGVPRGEVLIMRGERSNMKLVYLPVEPGTAAKRLGAS
jgi:hypothetical protein